MEAFNVSTIFHWGLKSRLLEMLRVNILFELRRCFESH